MVTLAQLWLPILLSGVAVFFASFVLRCVFKHHANDFAGIPDEEAAMDALRKAGVGPGQYMFPHCTGMEALKDPAWQERWKRGPAGHMYVFAAGEMNMGKSLMQSFAFNVVGSFLAAYLATMAIPVGASSELVMRFISTAAMLIYGAALTWGPIWKAENWSMYAKEIFDALVYGLVTGVVFMLLWPS